MRNAVRFDHIETGWIEAMEATRIYGFSKYRGAREHSIKIVVSISLSKAGISDSSVIDFASIRTSSTYCMCIKYLSVYFEFYPLPANSKCNR